METKIIQPNRLALLKDWKNLELLKWSWKSQEILKFKVMEKSRKFKHLSKKCIL